MALSVVQSVLAAEIEVWHAHEITLHAERTYAHPFEDVDVTAMFSGPKGVTLRRPAFWDGGDTWRIRFAPTAPGNWTYVTTCSNAVDLGLNQVKGQIHAIPNTSTLPVYQHGFLRVSDNKRSFCYRDGKPFFWLGEVHWLWEKERLEESNKPGWTSEFRGMVDKRKVQGFNVYQVELFDWWQGATLGGSSSNKVSELNLASFQKNIDPKWKYLADNGFVVATTLGILPKDASPELGKRVARIAKYVCARYGAYPSAWLMFQECTANFTDSFTSEGQRQRYMDIVREVGHTFQREDGYHHPRTAHSDASIVTAYRGEDWLDFTMFQAGHSKALDHRRYYDFYFDPKQTLPQIEGEADFERLFEGSELRDAQVITDADVRDKAYRAMLSGCCGFTYGAGGVWQATWDKERTGNQTVYGTTPWRDGIDLPGGKQLALAQRFFQMFLETDFKPRPECDDLLSYDDSIERSKRPILASNPKVTRALVYFPAGPSFHCQFHNLHKKLFSMVWFDPRTGQMSTAQNEERARGGTLACPDKPDSQDWVLYIAAADREIDVIGDIPSRWLLAKAELAELDKKNVAREAVVTASSTDLASHVYDPKNAIDGNTDTADWHHWSNDAAIDPATPAKPVWLQLEWKSAVLVDTIVVHTMDGYAARDYQIQVDDGSGWKTLAEASVTDNVSSVRKHKLRELVTVRRLRFLGLRGPSNQPTIVRVVEIQVFRK